MGQHKNMCLPTKSIYLIYEKNTQYGYELKFASDRNRKSRTTDIVLL